MLAGLPAASADELADLRANQELLQERIDQLSQAPPPGAPGQPPQVLKIQTTKTVRDADEHARALSDGWFPNPAIALKALEERANNAARLAYDNRRMSENGRFLPQRWREKP